MIYYYRCVNCNNIFEYIFQINPVLECPFCSSRQVEKNEELK